MMSGIGKETEEPKDIKPIKLYYNSTLSYAEYVAFISNTDIRVLWGRSWKRLGLSITRLADRVPAGSNSNPKIAGFFGSRPNLEASCTTIISWAR